MNLPTININNTPIANHPASFREVKIGKTLYCVTSVFKGEKELGSTLEKLAVRHVLDEINTRTSNLLHA